MQSRISKLNEDLSLSLRRPTSRTLRLIDRALSYLTPFESARASVASHAEKRELLDLINIHRMVLYPYIDIDKIESNLRFQ